MQFVFVSLQCTEEVSGHRPDVPHVGGPYMPDVEGSGIVVERSVPQLPPVLPDEFGISVGTPSRRSDSLPSTPGRDRGAVMSRHQQQLPTSTQASGKLAPHKAPGAGPSPEANAGVDDIPIPQWDEPLPDTDIDSEEMSVDPECVLEPGGNHNDDSVYLLSEPPAPPSAFMHNDVQCGQFSWGAGAMPSPPEGYAAVTDPPHCLITAFDE